MLGGFFEGFGKVEKREKKESEARTGKTIEEMEAYAKEHAEEIEKGSAEKAKALEENLSANDEENPGNFPGEKTRDGWDEPLSGSREESMYQKKDPA
ncbi:MAG: hypothetical protein LR008_02250 [Candidatus Pacebacteria bacterium]|nr:hypothetical protein [Candidatus Paceibacterota bacterium]